MLSQDILKAVKSYTEKMTESVTFILQTGDHPRREELKKFLSDLSAVSDKLILTERDSALRSPISFSIEVNNKATGVEFSGIPSGHEFNSLILAVLQAAGAPIKLDDGLQRLIKAVDEPMHFEVFVSLSCHNCPDVVQAVNQFALLNDAIKAEMIDGGLFQTLVKERDIQGVPSVYLNGELFANGKVTAAELLNTLQELKPDLSAAVKTSDKLPLQDVVVIGGGPAGISAAIYAARKGLQVTLVADRLGGQVKDTMGIENLISVPKTTGAELSGALTAHMNEYDVTVKEHLRVAEIEKGDIQTLTLSSGEIIHSKTLIVATGANWRELGVPGEKEGIGNGVAYCPHCDGPFFKDKDVAVIGGGNSGIEAALDLAGIVKSVTVFEFLPELKADKVLVDQALSRNNISIMKNVATKSIHSSADKGNRKVSGIEYFDRDSGETHVKNLEGVFVQIGLVPNTSFIRNIVDLSSQGEIIIDEKCRTSTPGIYACGDATTVPYKQIIISMGEGAKASLSAFEHLLAHSKSLEQLYESKFLGAQHVA